jgi:hypothetical protein
LGASGLRGGSTWISGPVSTVLSPCTLPKPTCGRTIQNTAPSRATSAAARCRRVRTSTCLWSRLSSTPLTSPITTPRYFTGVMPTRSPPPSLKLMVISGPRSS